MREDDKCIDHEPSNERQMKRSNRFEFVQCAKRLSKTKDEIFRLANDEDIQGKENIFNRKKRSISSLKRLMNTVECVV